MSIAQKVASVVSTRDAATQRETFIDCLRFLALGKLDGSVYAAPRLAEAAGRQKAADILKSESFRTIKSAVAPGTTIDGTWAAPLSYAGAASAWLASLSNSAFDTLLAGGMRVAPMNSRVGVVSLGAIGSAPGEGSLKILSSMSLAGDTLVPRKGAAVVVVTSELLKMAGQVGGNLIDAELRVACTKIVDQEFLRVISSGADTAASLGATAASVRGDISAALGRMKTGASSRLYIIAEAMTVKAWSTLADTSGAAAFVGIGPLGGEFAPGLRVIVSDGVPQGSFLVIDATGLAGGSDGLTIDASNVASLHVDDAPDSPPTASTIFRSMFQSNSIAIKCERWFAAARMRDDAVQVISGADYGNSPPV